MLAPTRLRSLRMFLDRSDAGHRATGLVALDHGQMDQDPGLELRFEFLRDANMTNEGVSIARDFDVAVALLVVEESERTDCRFADRKLLLGR